MSLIFADKIQESTSSVGTGDILLTGASVGCRTFASSMSINDTCHYSIDGGTEWETGIGTLTAPAVLQRTTVLASSNNNNLTNLSVGIKTIMLTLTAQLFKDALIKQDTAILSQNETTTINNALTILSVYEEVPGSNQVPTMTDFSSPSGLVTRSSENGGQYAAWKAFDKNSSSGWFVTSRPCWLQYQFPSAKTISGYTIDCTNDTARCPTSWEFSGSNDGSSWVVLDTRTNVTPRWAGAQLFNLSSPATYIYFKIYITSGFDVSNNFTYIAELALIGVPSSVMLQPVVDYKVSKPIPTKRCNCVITRIKSGTSISHSIDYN